MTRVCSGCDRHSCRGECYSEERVWEAEEVNERPHLTAEEIEAYRKWCAEQDLRNGIVRDLRFTMDQQRKVA